MKLTDLINFFAGETSASKLAQVIAVEVDSYTQLSKKTGSSMEVMLEDEGGKVEIDVSEVRMLCKSLLNKELSQWDVHYICDALLLSESVKFKNIEIQNTIEEMSDPDVHGELTESRIWNVLKNIT